jgi:hypothetical protein
LTQIVVEFNTVGQFLVQPGLQQLLRLAWGQSKIELPSKMVTKQALTELDKLPLKFDNGLRLYGLKAGERLLGVVFQPGIWQDHGYFFHRQIAATTLLALTDRELILVEEERTGQPNAYGWIFTFYPLACVMMVELKPGETWQELHLHLTRGDGIADRQVILEPQAALAWQNLWAYRGAEAVQIA